MSNDTPDTRSSCDNHAASQHSLKSSSTNGAVSTRDPLALIPLKTVLELRAEDAVTDVYITAVPVKSANSVISALRPLVNETAGVDLQHLRRFVKPTDLPASVSTRFSGQCGDQELPPGYLYLMVGPIESIQLDVLNTSLSSAVALAEDVKAPIWKTPVPLLPPTSQTQATQWSASHWPTIYKKHNPFGPHPGIVSRAEAELRADLDVSVAMAHRVALTASTSGLGEAIGAVITSRSGGASRVVALAGDARWAEGKTSVAGNVMAHAALRAIGMVALRLTAAEHESAFTAASSLDAIESGLFHDKPMLPEEKAVFEGETLPAGGYLCHNLEIYLTHEPCVMCSMALLHSRFGKVVFGKRMPQTGGLCGETCSSPKDCGEESEIGGLGHGLFWRKELNWSLLAWEAPNAEGDTEVGVEVGASVQV